MALQLVKDHNFRSPIPNIAHASLEWIKSGMDGDLMVFNSARISPATSATRTLLYKLFNSAGGFSERVPCSDFCFGFI